VLNKIFAFATAVMSLANIGFVAFAAGAPQGSIPWWVTATFAGINAVALAIPGEAGSLFKVDPPAPPQAGH